MSREHHWWPVGHQKHWADDAGNVHMINPDGQVEIKKFKNRKIGKKSHGHTTLRGGPWETNFEGEFSNIDGKVHDILETVGFRRTIGSPFAYVWSLLKLFFKKDRELIDLCKSGTLSEKDDRLLLEYILLLLVRWPSHRAKAESFSWLKDKESKEEVGKGNMLTRTRIIRELMSNRVIGLHYFVFMHTWGPKFILGDGVLENITSSLNGFSLRGHALLPLTPELCVYLCTPNRITNGINYSALNVAPWMVHDANAIMQVYSKDILFFRGKKPKVLPEFERREFLEFKYHDHRLIDYLNAISGAGSKYRTLAGKLVQRHPWGHLFN